MAPARCSARKGSTIVQNARESTREYDSDLRMFREPAREPDLAMLLFLRWLAQRGELEHQVFGPSTGIYAAPRAGAKATLRRMAAYE
jgi:hypothetical protein